MLGLPTKTCAAFPLTKMFPRSFLCLSPLVSVLISVTFFMTTLKLVSYAIGVPMTTSLLVILIMIGDVSLTAFRSSSLGPELRFSNFLADIVTWLLRGWAQPADCCAGEPQLASPGTYGTLVGGPPPPGVSAPRIPNPLLPRQFAMELLLMEDAYDYEVMYQAAQEACQHLRDELRKKERAMQLLRNQLRAMRRLLSSQRLPYCHNCSPVFLLVGPLDEVLEEPSRTTCPWRLQFTSPVVDEICSEL